MLNISLSVSWPFEILLLRILFRSLPHFDWNILIVDGQFLEFFIYFGEEPFQYGVGEDFFLLILEATVLSYW